ncbi:MAG: hypothetical protein KDB07_11895, partial [Planctomycetes bacterium]|nr:hypothetical protein [Planctomycetota bacterium]
TAGSVYDARRQHIAALTNWSNDPLNDVLLSVLNATRATYQEALENYDRKVRLGVSSALRAMPRLEEIATKYRNTESIASRSLTTAAQFNEDTFRESLQGLYEGDALEQMVKLEKERIENHVKEISDLEKPRILAVFKALETIRSLGKTVQAAGEVRSDISIPNVDTTMQSLGVDYLWDRLDKSALNAVTEAGRHTYNIPEGSNSAANSGEGISYAAYDKYREAIRDLLLADIYVIQARAARLLNDHTTSEELLGTLDGKRLGKINTALILAVEGMKSVDHDGDGLPDDELISSDPNRIKEGISFLRRRIAEFDERAAQGIEGSAAKKMLFSEASREIKSIVTSLEKASFEHAELAYQVMLAKLEFLTGPERPAVSREMAVRYGDDHRRWIRQMDDFKQGKRASAPKHPLEANDYEEYPSAQELRDYIDLERDYRQHYHHVLALYGQFLESENEDIHRRAHFGLASAMLDHNAYNLEWKWRNVNPKPVIGDDKDSGYGTFAWVESTPEVIASEYPEEGRWLSLRDANELRKKGMSLGQYNEIFTLLDSLREMPASKDVDLFAALALRLGQLQEMYTPEDRARDNDFSKLDHHGVLAKAVKENYLPMLTDTSRVTDQALIENRYIPLEIHFREVDRKLNRWMAQVDQGSEDDLQKFFRAISIDKSDASEREVSTVYTKWYEAVAMRQPGLLDITDRVYDFNRQLADLASALANLKLANLKVDSTPSERSEAKKYRDLADHFNRIAGRYMLDYLSKYPDQSGESERQLNVGNAFFDSSDYIFAINAYNKYFENRRQKDLKSTSSNIFFVANRIGECYSALGLYHGQNPKALEGQAGLEGLNQMKLDGAIPAFFWAREQARIQLQALGEGGFPL